jgi:hypothetical protein
MKILLVSMPSIHFFRWTQQLKNEGHEVLWFDIIDGGKEVDQLNWVKQFVGWKLKQNYFGRYFLKSKFRKLYRFIQRFNENDTAKEFEKVLKIERPDVVHSFALYVSCTPILEVMLKYPNLKWIYSSWGSDLYHFQNLPEYLSDIKKVLPRIDYLFTDCKRDYGIALKYGFKGKFMGVYPGGGGFDIQKMNRLSLPISHRKILLIKGYQGRSGRAINVLKAIKGLKTELVDYKILVFGADIEVSAYIENSSLFLWKNLQVYGKISRDKVLKIMGESLIYVGNSDSDGLPNTLLEAICLGAFPIQSNPGNATAEVIQNRVNGFLIEDCDDIPEIKLKINESLKSMDLIKKAFFYNKDYKKKLDYYSLKQKILNKYKEIETL